MESITKEKIVDAMSRASERNSIPNKNPCLFFGNVYIFIDGVKSKNNFLGALIEKSTRLKLTHTLFSSSMALYIGLNDDGSKLYEGQNIAWELRNIGILAECRLFK